MILIASPSQIFCRRCRDALAGSSPLHQVANRQGLTLALSEYKPNLVFLDHTEKPFGPTRAVCNMIKGAAGSRFVVVTREPRPTEAITFIRAGAKGYCASSIGPVLLRKSVRIISGGEIWIGRKFVPSLIDEFVRTSSENSPLNVEPAEQPSKFTVFTGLSPREREIASLVAAGQHNKSISNNLHISEKTVKAHLTTIFRKLQIDGRTQLALAVIGTRR